MNIQDIKKILAGGESITVEFKESKTELNKDVFESVGGMLNRMGGHLILGVKDGGIPVGVDKSCVGKIKKNFVTLINNPDKVSPTFYTQLEEFRWTAAPCFTLLYRTALRFTAFPVKYMTATKTEI